MAEQDIDDGFAACDTDLLNRFFADYYRAHTQGGTNARQRNLHHLFKWLLRTRGHQDPWTRLCPGAGTAAVGTGSVGSGSADRGGRPGVPAGCSGGRVRGSNAELGSIARRIAGQS
jgi:hypothetical protein